MSEDMRKMIDKVKNFKRFVNENNELTYEDMRKMIDKVKNFKRFVNENNELTYNDVFKKQQIDNPYSDVLFSTENSKFVEEIIDIKKLRELNGFSDDEDEIEQTMSYFNDLGMDEDYSVSKKLMNKIVNGVKLSPIVVDENYKVLDGSHRLAAYSELYYYHSYDFDFNGKLKIYKRISN